MALSIDEFFEKWCLAISKEYGSAFKDGMKADLEEMMKEADIKGYARCQTEFSDPKNWSIGPQKL